MSFEMQPTFTIQAICPYSCSIVYSGQSEKVPLETVIARNSKECCENDCQLLSALPLSWGKWNLLHYMCCFCGWGQGAAIFLQNWLVELCWLYASLLPTTDFRTYLATFASASREIVVFFYLYICATVCILRFCTYARHYDRGMDYLYVENYEIMSKWMYKDTWNIATAVQE